MRVLYLHQYFNTPEMAGATRSYELGRRLVAKGHEVHMITTSRASDLTHEEAWRTSIEHGITVHWAKVPYSNKMSFVARMKSFLTFAILAARKAASLNGDVVFATSTPLTIAFPAAYARRKLRIPMVFEVRDLWPAVPIALRVLKNPLSKWAARRLEVFAYRNASQIVALAPGMKEEIAETGYPADRITVIPNGCDIDLFAENPRISANLRFSHKWLHDRPLVVYAGAIGRINAVDYLVEMSSKVLEIDEEIRFVVIGGGVEEDNVQALAHKVGVYGKNLFMLGQMSKREAAAWIVASTMTVALVNGPRFIWKDATQNKFFDSLAAAKPVACNYDGWQAKVASEAGAAVILDPGDHLRAANQLVGALRDEQWMIRASAAAYNLARNTYSRDKHAADLEQVLNKAVSHTSAGNSRNRAIL